MAIPPDTLVLDGRFRVLRSLARGGMGEVYEGEQVSLGRKVALKVLKDQITAQPAMVERFRREARLLSSIEHPSVVRVIDFGHEGNNAWLVMELVEGRTLREVLDESGALMPDRAVRTLHQLAEGLAAIHAKGIIHRDLKPENVVLSQGPRGETARLLDFGIAKLLEPEPQDSSLSQVGQVLGTPEYVSPEQAMGHELDARSDLYSFGVLAYRALAGRLPFDGPGPRQFLAQHATTPPMPLDKARPGLSPDLVALVMRCLEKEPSARIASADALAEGFERLRAVFSGAFAPTTANTDSYGTVAKVVELPRTVSSGQGIAARKSQNVALMLTDIQGYTARTSAQTRDESARMLKEHDELLLPIARTFRGDVVQRRGDALLIVFEGPTEAVRCGMAMQDALYRFNQAAPAGWQLRVRVCIHLGEILLRGKEVIGEPVKVVERVEELAAGGEVAFTEAVRLAMDKASVPHEARGEVETPAGSKLAVYRCIAKANGAPFGGDLAPVRPRLSLVKSSTTQLRLALEKPRMRVWVAGAFGVLLLVGLVLLFSGDPTAGLARDALVRNRPADALQIIELAERQKKGSAELLQLKAAALHQTNRHSDELAVLKSANVDRPEPLMVSSLAAHLWTGTSEKATNEVLRRAPAGKLEARMAEVLDGPAGPESMGALRYLEKASKLSASNRVDGYIHELDSTDCAIREEAVRRLGALGDARAAGPLESLKPTTREGVGQLLDVFDDCAVSSAKETAKKLRARQ